jgi:peptidoglycan/xylan/chitin deacetylase (PgdA/CDA1 family)
MPLRIALTFDDGPHPSYTAKLIELLAERIIPATFFVLGGNAKCSPHLLNRMHDAGHEIGNHGWSHTPFSQLKDSEILDELKRTNELIQQHTSQSCTIYRPPYGAITDQQESLIRNQLGYELILWNVDSLDWKNPSAEQLLRNTTEIATKKAILLFHDFSNITCETLPRILDTFERRDCTFYTASRILTIQRDESA